MKGSMRNSSLFLVVHVVPPFLSGRAAEGSPADCRSGRHQAPRPEETAAFLRWPRRAGRAPAYRLRSPRAAAETDRRSAAAPRSAALRSQTACRRPAAGALTDRITSFFDHEQVAEPVPLPDAARLRRTSFSLSPSGLSCRSTSSRMRSVSSLENRSRGSSSRDSARLCLGVPAKVTDALLIHGLAGRFSAVVQQHRPPQTGLGRNLPDRANGVPPDIVAGGADSAADSPHRHELGQRRAMMSLYFSSVRCAHRPHSSPVSSSRMRSAAMQERRPTCRRIAAAVSGSIANPSSDAKQ